MIDTVAEACGHTRNAKNDLSDELLFELKSVCGSSLKRNVSLQAMSRWRVGGEAQCLIAPTDTEQLIDVLKVLVRHGSKYLVIGSTTNLLFADEGVSVVTLQIGNAMSRMLVQGRTVTCEAGAWVPGFARRLAIAGLSGAEHIAGIPGTLGGLVYMNGGSQRKGIGDHIVEVNTVTPTGERKSYTPEQCLFQYRASVFQQLDEIITGARFEFEPGNPQTIRRELLAILGSRRAKFPQKQPNCGSVFVSNPAMYADYGPPGKVIEACGLKGMVQGQAQISPMHANFIVNLGGAQARDILHLIHHARTQVQQHTGYDMKAEAIYVEPHGAMLPAHVKAEQIFS